jgi:outer membrane protein OmpA-like peptidoglycan-associated protein
MFMKCVPIALVLTAMALAPTAPAGASEGHPLLTPYPGSKLSNRQEQQFDRYPIILGIDKQGEFISETLGGRVTRLNYQQPRERSLLEISRNYEKALTDAGATVLWVCEGKECGPAWASSAWNRFNGITAKTGDQVRYFAAKLTAGGRVAYAAVTVGRDKHQVDIVELAAMETGLVRVTADAIAKGLRESGQVVLDGIFFDTDKATIKAESQPALEEIAKFLKTQEGAFFVVGHTDTTGALDHNMALSRARAAAVVDALRRDHGIAAGRLDPHGVGPLAPAAANEGDPGRARNRRVALVKR